MDRGIERMPLRKKRIIAAIVIGIGLPWLVIVGMMWHRRQGSTDARELRLSLERNEAAIRRAAQGDDLAAGVARKLVVQLDSLRAKDSALASEADKRK